MEPQIVETDIPISYLLVVGDVPMYYYDGQGKAVGENKASAPSIAIPPPVTNENSHNSEQEVPPVTTPDHPADGTTTPLEPLPGGADLSGETGGNNTGG
jgi:hypothetical protein